MKTQCIRTLLFFLMLMCYSQSSWAQKETCYKVKIDGRETTQQSKIIYVRNLPLKDRVVSEVFLDDKSLGEQKGPFLFYPCGLPWQVTIESSLKDMVTLVTVSKIDEKGNAVVINHEEQLLIPGKVLTTEIFVDSNGEMVTNSTMEK